MQIKTIEHSPFPKLKSVKTTRLLLSKSEWNTIALANKLLVKAEQLVFDHLNHEGFTDTTYTLSDIDQDLSMTIRNIDVFIEEYQNGLKLD